MKILLLPVGKTSNAHLSAMCADYAQRISHYAPFSVETIPDIKNAKSLSQAELRRREAECIMKRIRPEDHVVLLDEHGKEFRSIEYAAWLRKQMLTGTRRLVFVIGGAYGFDEAVCNRAAEKISLSKLTFSHQMVRLFFMEQLYRAFTILNGEPYHHE